MNSVHLRRPSELQHDGHQRLRCAGAKALEWVEVDRRVPSIFAQRGHDRAAFVSSSASLIGMVASAAFGIYPYVLPSVSNPALALTIDNTLGGRHGLLVGLAWWVPGMILATIYVIFVHIKFSGKVNAGAEDR